MQYLKPCGKETGYTMSLAETFYSIKKYHEALGYDYTNATPEEKMQHFRNHALALYQEVAEIIDSTPWKPWRSIEDQKFHMQNVPKEIVDCIFFLGSISEILDISPEELNITFNKVLADNYSRIATGYNNKPEERR
jgi:dimeric dUTPase (all-alpha-NTP-PPase superfamily)